MSFQTDTCAEKGMDVEMKKEAALERPIHEELREEERGVYGAKSQQALDPVQLISKEDLRRRVTCVDGAPTRPCCRQMNGSQRTSYCRGMPFRRGKEEECGV